MTHGDWAKIKAWSSSSRRACPIHSDRSDGGTTRAELGESETRKEKVRERCFYIAANDEGVTWIESPTQREPTARGGTFRDVGRRDVAPYALRRRQALRRRRRGVPLRAAVPAPAAAHLPLAPRLPSHPRIVRIHYTLAPSLPPSLSPCFLSWVIDVYMHNSLCAGW